MRLMTPAEQIEALLDIVDDSRDARPETSQKLKVLGLAQTRGKGFWPTQAGWNLLAANPSTVVPANRATAALSSPGQLHLRRFRHRVRHFFGSGSAGGQRHPHRLVQERLERHPLL